MPLSEFDCMHRMPDPKNPNSSDWVMCELTGIPCQDLKKTDQDCEEALSGIEIDKFPRYRPIGRG